MDKKKAIVKYYYGEGKENKAATGRRFGVSPRTVGRYLDEYEENVSLNAEWVEDEVEKTPVDVILIPEDATHKSLVSFHLFKYHKKIDGVWHWWDSDQSFWDTDHNYDYSNEIERLITGGEVIAIGTNETTEPESPKNFYIYRTPSMIQITKVDERGANVVVVQEGDKQWIPTCEVLDSSNIFDMRVLEEAYIAASYVEKVKNFIKDYPDYHLEVDIADQCLRIDYKGYKHEFRDIMVDRMIEQLEQGVEPTNLCNFAVRLLKNPSKKAVDELYEFLIASDIEINEDGMVVCFKKVRDDYKDCHTGTMDNSVGVTVEMPRFAVDDNSEHTCSHGLHICSKAYLSHFGGARVLKVLVDPADFVSIPKDYYSIDGNGEVKAKARVCKYFVKEEITNEIY